MKNTYYSPRSPKPIVDSSICRAKKSTLELVRVLKYINLIFIVIQI